jgi:DNA polymerase-3 subunit gamma/tau
MAEALKRVAEKEKITIDDESLQLIAKKAQGSFRDGIKMLDQLSSFEKIDGSLIESQLGGGKLQSVVAILESVFAKDATKGLLQVKEQLDLGMSVKELNLAILELLRQALLIKHKLGEI